jgi:hypothetical protein
MPKKLDMEKLLEANPSVDAEKLLAALELIRELKKSGVIVNSGYDLAIPFSKRVVQVDENRQVNRLPKRR